MTTAETDDRAELAAYRDGFLQPAYDPHTADSPHITSYAYGTYEPVTHVQCTYEGQAAWKCVGCLRITLTNDDTIETCRTCGEGLEALMLVGTCDREDHGVER